MYIHRHFFPCRISIHENSVDSEFDPQINFYQDISSLETHYCTSPNDFKNNYQFFSKGSFPVLHLNIRSMNNKVSTQAGKAGKKTQLLLSKARKAGFLKILKLKHFLI